MLFRAFLAAMAFLIPMNSASAAEWWRAETDHFILYSKSDEKETVDFATDLERFDRALRILRGLPTNQKLAPVNKLTVYQFGKTKHIGYFAARRPSSIGGFYIPRAGGSVSFVPLKDKQLGGASEILFHEYAHRFMFQHAAAAYPAWYVEGYAELHSTLELLDEGGFRIGQPPASRSEALFSLGRYSLEDLLDPPEVDDRDAEDNFQPYVRGFSLTHYLTFSKERQGQLGEYLRLLNEGVSSLDAAKQAFGDIDELEKELNQYQFKKGRGLQLKMKEAPVDVQIRKLGEDEVAMMDMHMQAQRGVTEKEARSLVGKARSLVKSYPDSMPVLLAAVEAEFDAKNDAEAAALAKRAVKMDPGVARSHYYLGLISLRAATADKDNKDKDEKDRVVVSPEDKAKHFDDARRHFAAAAKADPNDPKPLFQFYETYIEADEEPSQNARVALETAYTKAQFDPSIRVRLVDLMLREDRERDAMALLGPLTFNAHDPKSAEKLRKVYKFIEENKIAEARDALKAAQDPENEDENATLLTLDQHS